MLRFRVVKQRSSLLFSEWMIPLIRPRCGTPFKGFGCHNCFIVYLNFIPNCYFYYITIKSSCHYQYVISNERRTTKNCWFIEVRIGKWTSSEASTGEWEDRSANEARYCHCHCHCIFLYEMILIDNLIRCWARKATRRIVERDWVVWIKQIETHWDSRKVCFANKRTNWNRKNLEFIN